MRLKQIHEFFVKEGLREDPAIRGKHNGNPYPDSEILNGDEDKEIKNILIGIDIDTEELLLAERLRENGEKIDLVLAHHPRGKASANIHFVMHMHEELMRKAGVPSKAAGAVMAGKIDEVKRGLALMNHSRTVDAARLLGIPLMCAHTVADNHAYSFLERLMKGKKPKTAGDVVEILKEVPEYKAGTENGVEPRLFIGSAKNKCGKMGFDMTGGVEPAKEVYGKLARAGVRTIVGIALSDRAKKEVAKHKINYIVAGHIATDNLGVNLLLDKLEREGEFRIIPCSGFVRVKRAGAK